MLISLIRRYVRRYTRQVCLVVALLVVQAVANLYLPNLTADIINNGIEKGDIHYIWTTGAWMLAITFVVGVMSIVAVYFASKVSMGLGRDIRGAVFKSVQRFSAQEINHFGTPSLITRNTNDVQQIQIFLQMALTIMVLAPIMCIGGVIMALKEDVKLSALLVVVVPVMLIVISVLMAKAVPLFRSMQSRIDRVNLVLREQITGVRVIRAFIRTGQEQGRFAEANGSLTNTGLRVNRMLAGAAHCHGGDEPFVRRCALVRWPPDREREHADREPHGFFELHPADPHVGDDRRDDGDPATARGSKCRSNRRGATRRAFGRGPAGRCRP